MFGRVSKRDRCPVPGCRNRGTPSFLIADVCAEHREQRAQAARDAWVDPATLTRETWTSAGMLLGEGGPSNGVESACGACGHPRWAHAKPGFFDGPCVVPECVACDGEPGHAPGYVPSTVAAAS